MSRLRFRRFWMLLGVLLVLATLYVCLRPVSGQPPTLLNLDKLQHFTAYLVLTAWFGALLDRRRYGWMTAFMLLLGGGIEVAQGAMQLGRDAELADMLANTLGIVAGIGVSLAGRDSWLARIERWLAPT